MIKAYFFLALTILCISCDDGDIIVTNFDFEDQTLALCGGEESLVFYKINSAAQESLSLSINESANILAQEIIDPIQLSSTNRVNYRSYNDAVTSDYFCSSIPPVSPQVTQEYIAVNGTATLNSIITRDDNDGIPAIEEIGPDPDNPQDTDMDGIPDFYDPDDDGDNVLTVQEIDNANSDGDDDPLTNPKDTDGDGIPDYLDTDDDGDMVITRYESTDGDLNPTNDVSDGTTPDYLNNMVSNSIKIDAYRVHSYDQVVDIEVVLNDIPLSNGEETILEETLNMGTIEGILSNSSETTLTGTITTTPDF